MIPVTLMMAISVDGKIAKDKNQLANWTSPEDKKLFVAESKKHGVVMMGENTFNTFPSPLPKRLNVVFSENQKPDYDNVKYVSGDLIKVLDELESLGYKSALLGGGCYLNSLFLKNKLISQIILTVEPKIFGQGLSLFDVDLEASLELETFEKLNNNTLAIRYQVKYTN
ncbi:MAG: dihydrofolate reductase family protein [Candidatus Falkowbacteria bacterium]